MWKQWYFKARAQGRGSSVEEADAAPVTEQSPKTLLFLVPNLSGAANNDVFVYCWFCFKEMRRSKLSNFCRGAC